MCVQKMGSRAWELSEENVGWPKNAQNESKF